MYFWPKVGRLSCLLLLIMCVLDVNPYEFNWCKTLGWVGLGWGVGDLGFFRLLTSIGISRSALKLTRISTIIKNKNESVCGCILQTPYDIFYIEILNNLNNLIQIDTLRCFFFPLNFRLKLKNKYT